MYEFTRVPGAWEHGLRAGANEIWVPSLFCFQTFVDAGAPIEKLRIVPEGIDTKFFDPSVHRPLRIGKKVNVTSPEFRKKFKVNWNNIVCNRDGSAFTEKMDDPNWNAFDFMNLSLNANAAMNNNKKNKNIKNNNSSKDIDDDNDDEFIFFSQFKWESRKGWPVLFESYFRAFAKKRIRKLMNDESPKPEFLKKKFRSRASERKKQKMKEKELDREKRKRSSRNSVNSVMQDDDQQNDDNDEEYEPNVSLIVLSILFNLEYSKLKYSDAHDTRVGFADIQLLVNKLFPDPETRPALSELPRFCLFYDGVSEKEMAQLFRGADAFVLPTRGEGWGLPTMQAMSMGLPTISTNWGGSVDFTTKETSFLIELDALDEVSRHSVYGWRPGKKWATPSVSHLRQLLRHVYTDREHAIEVGERARDHIVRNFDDFEVLRVVDRRLQEIAFAEKGKSYWQRS